MGGSGNYISREEVLALTDDYELTLPDDEIFFEYIDPKKVAAIPAADVRPVVRSDWKIHHKTNIAVCKCCSYQYMMGAPWHEYPPRFCPNCGADIRGEAE